MHGLWHWRLNIESQCKYQNDNVHVPINGIPHSPTPWGNSGDLTEYHVKNPSPGALPDVNTPIHGQESKGD